MDSKLALIIGGIALKCIDKTPELRPTHDWLAVILRATHDLLYELY